MPGNTPVNLGPKESRSCAAKVSQLKDFADPLQVGMGGFGVWTCGVGVCYWKACWS